MQTAVAADPRVAALEANLGGFFRQVGGIAPAVMDPDTDVVSFSTGIPFPMMNGISGAAFAPGTEARRTSEVLERALGRGLPFLWTLTPSSHPEIERVLTARGLQRESDPAMYVDPRTVAPTVAPPGVRAEVADRADVDDHVDLMIRGFGMPETLRAPLTSMLRQLPAGSVHPVRGWLDDEPAGIGMLYDIGGVAGLYNIATLGPARGRGVGYAVTNRLVDLARELGHRHCVLVATSMGLPVYERLGFATSCRVTHFLGGVAPS